MVTVRTCFHESIKTQVYNSCSTEYVMPFSVLQLLFYIQDSDDVYGLIKFHPLENQKIESNPTGRFLSLSFARERGTVGDVQLVYTALYIPAGALDPARAKDGILNISRRSILTFPEGKTQDTLNIPIRNDAFLQNGAHFLIQVSWLYFGVFLFSLCNIKDIIY